MAQRRHCNCLPVMLNARGHGPGFGIHSGMWGATPTCFGVEPGGWLPAWHSVVVGLAFMDMAMETLDDTGETWENTMEQWLTIVNSSGS